MILKVGNYGIPYTLDNNVLNIGNGAYILKLENLVVLNMEVTNINRDKNKFDIVISLTRIDSFRTIYTAVTVGATYGKFIINNKEIDWVKLN